MKYFLIAGEASGDLHASHLIRSLRLQDSEAEFRFIGGEMMAQAAGVAPLMAYQDLAYMGFVAVIRHLPTILRAERRCKEAICEWRPDRLILIDYPGFNLRIARYVKSQGICPIFYYISPKLWAWKSYRIKAMRRDVDRILSILPFEVEYFSQRNYPNISYVGNPTLDEVTAFRAGYGETRSDFCARHHLDAKLPIVALLAGSRRQEIRDNLHIMTAALRRVGMRANIVLACAPGISDEYYAEVCEGETLSMVRAETYPLLLHADAALVTSGTATLETALFGTPQVVCYKMMGGRITNWLQPRILSVKYISLVNLIADAPVVPELIAAEMTPERVASHLRPLLDKASPEYRAQISGYDTVQRRLGSAGAPDCAAQEVIKF